MSNSEETKDEKKLPADTEINPVHECRKNSCIGKKDMKGDKKMEISDVKLNELSTLPVQADSEIHLLSSGSPKKKEKT